MSNASQRKANPIAGCREQASCGHLAGCGGHRSKFDIASAQVSFGGNKSSAGNGHGHFGFRKCNGVRCKIKCNENNMLVPLNSFRSRYSQRGLPLHTDEHLDCKSKNVIYLVSCKLCSIQYVGETQREFGVRMREHWDKIRKGDRSQLVYAHFQSDDRHRATKIEDMLRFQIVEKIKTDDMLHQDQSLIRKRRLERELYWIAKLRTAYPLGLNDRLQALGISGNATDKTFTEFNYFRIENLFSSKKNRRSRRRQQKRKGCINEDDFQEFRDNLASTFITNKRKIESIILSKKQIFIVKFIKNQLFNTLVHEIKYMLCSRVAFASKASSIKKKTDAVIWKLDFAHKIIEDVNINALCNAKGIKQLLPAQLRGKNVIKHVFCYGRTVGSKILNYNKVLKDAESLSYQEIVEMQCDCNDSEFSNQHHGHITTGDLRIIKNDKLRKLCSFGTKFREIPRFNKEFIKNSFNKSINELVSKLVRKFKIPKNSFKDWADAISTKFDKNIDYLAVRQKRNVPVLSDRRCKQELESLQSKYVITVVDKAAGNYAFTCKKFYFLKLAQELGMQNTQAGNETYEQQNRTEQEICDSLVSSLDGFNALPKNTDRKLALLYHNPKFHKNPVKFRFIAGNVKVITSELDEIVAKILKMCKGHFSRLCGKYEEFSKIRYCFDIEKSADLKAGLDRFQGNAVTISVNDFSTLYTLFDHEHLIRNMTWLLDRLGKNSGCNTVKVGYEDAYWTKDSTGSYSIAEILEMIAYLIGNSYIKAFGNIFRQTKGIIMGGKSSGWLSDCSLMVDEFKYIDKLVKDGNIDAARTFKGLNRYRDDCTALNIDNFRQLSQEIYPATLELSQENDDLSKATVLDMDVKVINGFFRTKVYNKTDSFPFEVVSMPFLDSNIDRQICYKVFYSQIIRYERLCSYQIDFESRVRMLGKFLIRRNYRSELLEKEFKKVVKTYLSEFSRWDIPTNSKIWFNNIMTNHPTNSITDSDQNPNNSDTLSQPLPDNIGHRFHRLSQT